MKDIQRNKVEMSEMFKWRVRGTVGNSLKNICKQSNVNKRQYEPENEPEKL